MSFVDQRSQGIDKVNQRNIRMLNIQFLQYTANTLIHAEISHTTTAVAITQGRC